MPKLYKSWEKLKKELLKHDHYPVDKRVGRQKTLVFLVDELKYNPRIPILHERNGTLYDPSNEKQSTSKISSTSKSSSRPSSLPLKPTASTSKSALSSSRPIEPISRIAQSNLEPNSSTIKPAKVKRKSSLPSKESAPPSVDSIKQCVETLKPNSQSDKPSDVHVTSNVQPMTPDFDSPTPNIRSITPDAETDSDEDSAVHSVMKSNIDELVVRGPFEDEFEQYKDDDMNESEMSKNLKKIRYSPKKPPPIPKPAPNPRPAPLSRQMPPKVPEKPVEPPKPPEPPKPDWNQTKKQLHSNQLHDVLKDLMAFEKDIKADNDAVLIVKESVMKCLQEDETVMLIHFLDLIYKLDHTDDFEFWSALVQRLKRKLWTGTKYKVNTTNHDWIYQNYQNAIKSVCQYAASANPVLKLHYQDILFLVNHDPARQCKQEPLQSLGTVNVQIPDIKPKIKAEVQENSQPGEPRKVKLVKNEKGQDSFKISLRNRGQKQNLVFKPRF